MTQSPAVESTAVEQFMRYYEDDGYLAYEKLSDVAKRLISHELDAADIKHEIFDRGKEGSPGSKAKAPASARRTITRRQESRKKQYESKEEIISDMHDLAGLRVALYYPNDFSTVGSIIKRIFVEVKPPQDWPDRQLGPFPYRSLDAGESRDDEISGRHSRFPGYLARHYRVKLRDEDISEPAVRGKTLEIQLMSLLMLAWSKMHYELIYKPRPGLPTADEDDERLLDASSGIVIAGEQILRQIQINLDKKKQLSKLPFKNEHDLSSYFAEKWVCGHNNAVPERARHWLQNWQRWDHCLGKPDFLRILYKGLEMTGSNNPEKLDLIIQYCLDTYGPHLELPFLQLLFVAMVDQEDFKDLAAQQLQIPRSDTGALTRLEKARLARYMALILCNTLRQNDPDSFVEVLESGRGFAGPYPSDKEFLAHLHPNNLASQTCTPRSTANVLDLCRHLLSWDDLGWRAHLALSKLTVLFAQSDSANLTESDEFCMSMCPGGFVRLLAYCEAHQDLPLQDGLRLLEADHSGDAVFFFEDINLFQSAQSPKVYRDTMIVYWPEDVMDGNLGIWTVRNLESSPDRSVFYGFKLVREYLDCFTSR